LGRNSRTPNGAVVNVVQRHPRLHGAGPNADEEAKMTTLEIVTAYESGYAAASSELTSLRGELRATKAALAEVRQQNKRLREENTRLELIEYKARRYIQLDSIITNQAFDGIINDPRLCQQKIDAWEQLCRLVESGIPRTDVPPLNAKPLTINTADDGSNAAQTGADPQAITKEATALDLTGSNITPQSVPQVGAEEDGDGTL
jgi:hypothetical protein